MNTIKLLGGNKIGPNPAIIESVFNPDLWRSYFFIMEIMTVLICICLTLAFGHINWEDNHIYNTFGVNSICLYLDYPPAIFVGPGLYGICLILIVPYVLGMSVRIHLHYLEGEVSECTHRATQILSVLEILAFIVFGTVFAVNDEHTQLHVMCYVQMIFAVMLGSLRNLWYAKHFAPNMPQWKLVLGYIYVILLEVFGLFYAVGMMTVVLYQYDFLGPATNFVDKVFTFLFNAQVVIGFCVHNSYDDLKFTIALDRKEDGEKKNAMTALKAETEILMAK